MKQQAKILVNIRTIFFSLIIILLIMEISVRAFHFFYRGIPFCRSLGYYYDCEFGWKGKQIFPSPSTKKYKIFILGDSFTNGTGLKEEDLYYSIIKKQLGVEIFVYAGGGYGTLQEYLVLNRYFKKINPDLVVLQVCSNDFINNIWELESAAFYGNQLMVRPYLINGRIVYRFPNFLGKAGALLSHSRFCYFLLYRLEKLCFILAHRGFLPNIERDIAEKGMALEEFRKAVIVTDEIIKKIKDRVGKTPIIAFPVDDLQPYFGQFKKIFETNDIEFIETLPASIRQAEEKGINLRLEDGGHFNEIGHQICGQVLARVLINKIR